jgi:hypothetical protein
VGASTTTPPTFQRRIVFKFLPVNSAELAARRPQPENILKLKIIVSERVESVKQISDCEASLFFGFLHIAKETRVSEFDPSTSLDNSTYVSIRDPTEI